jgi:hypothetical protein
MVDIPLLSVSRPCSVVIISRQPHALTAGFSWYFLQQLAPRLLMQHRRILKVHPFHVNTFLSSGSGTVTCLYGRCLAMTVSLVPLFCQASCHNIVFSLASVSHDHEVTFADVPMKALVQLRERPSVFSQQEARAYGRL